MDDRPPPRPARARRRRAALLACALHATAFAEGDALFGGPPAPRPSPPPLRAALGILEYTRWPGPPRPRQVCIATAGPFGAELVAALGGGDAPHLFMPRLLPPNALPPPDCDAFVAGGWREAPLRDAIAGFAGRAVLTIGVGPLFCAAGGQFCLLPQAPGARFAANHDALARSGLTVNPRVLHLARPLPSREGL